MCVNRSGGANCFTLMFLFSLATACNFDSSMCGFTQDKTDKFDWIRHRGSTSSSATGPSSDHTSGSGRLTKRKTLQSFFLNQRACLLI